ncbi:MAG: hypothetical protein QNJ71_04050 [Acidimicrobiia bacterium]|nr:hypothetical protein [Acidimicrobiia bacterium]
MGTRASDRSRQEVARALLVFGEELDAIEANRLSTVLTINEPANDLLVNDPWGFLCGVICDYQMPADRAWATPYNLSQRLGGWSVELVASRPMEVRRAFLGPPAIHRFPNQTSGFVIDGARRVIDSYDGDASNVWADEPTARDLQRRLIEFKGISQKKAAMAVEILYAQLGVPIREMEGSDIAYDVHVRRVMLRSGLAERDDVAHMVEVARALHPERPGALDLPMWEIGRTWCHKSAPDCDSCVIAQSCPRLVSAADGVRGA